VNHLYHGRQRNCAIRRPAREFISQQQQNRPQPLPPVHLQMPADRGHYFGGGNRLQADHTFHLLQIRFY
jgi:hypothetical protein